MYGVIFSANTAKKTTKLTRGYRQPNYVDKTNAATIKSMLPYA